jgi:sulfur transfer complex TusBCD TusB component (DsrH family)
MLHYVQSCLICNSQKLERTQMYFNRGIDTEKVLYLHNGVLSAIKNNEFMKFLGKWMEQENIILKEVTQS